MSKLFKEVITQKALSFKLAGHSIGLPMMADEIIVNDENVKKHFKNVCVQLPIIVNQQLEDTLAILNLNKREFVIMAIENALEEAEKIMNEHDIFEYHTSSNA
jgi:hypothetical protein